MTSRQLTPRGHSSSGKASFIVVVSAVVLGAALVLVLVKFLTDRGRESADRNAAVASSVRASAAAQASEEKAFEASRQKYGRELRYCQALAQFGGADLYCLEDFAVQHEDLFFCGEIPAASRDGCLDRVARAAGQVSLCERLRQPEMQRRCYLDAAAKSGDSAGCEKVQDPQLRKACLALARADTAGCEAVTETSVRTLCFHRLAVHARKPGLCENVRNRQMPDGFQHELYDCWKDAAVATGRREDCDPIPHEGIRVNTSGWHYYSECRQKIELKEAGVQCREGPVDLTCRGKTAAAKNDFSMCEKGRSYTDMDLCTLTFSFRKNDGSKCPSIQDERLRSACVDIARISVTP